jgi:glycosyltransferase involved in cell wall biosynthesis
METISVVISAYNEEKKLPRTLKSVQWVDEIVVIDNSSTDQTSSICREFGAKVYTEPNHTMLNINKNIGIKKATKDWILYLDADEVITEELKKEIISILKDKKNTLKGYWIPRKNIIFGKWIEHGLWWPDCQLRLFRNGIGKFPCKHVHEKLEVEGETGTLREPYTHYNYETISQFLYKMDRIYTENEVEKLKSGGYQVAWFDAIRFPMSDFLKVYFSENAYKDGVHGLILSILQAFYSFVVFAKLWERRGFPEIEISHTLFSDEIKKTKHDLRYWMITREINETSSIFQKVNFKIKRRLLN